MPPFDDDSDKKEEKYSEHPPIINESIQMNVLITQLQKCISYVEWKEIFINHQNIDILCNIWKFIQDTLESLTKVISTSKISFTLYELLKENENEAHIKELAGHLFDQQKWSKTMEKFDKLKKLETILRQLLSMKYLKKVPSDLKSLHNFLKNAKDHQISEIENEIKVLECFQDELQIMIDREPNQAFRIKWNNYKEQFQDLKCLKMKFQSNQLELTPDLEKQLSHFVEKTTKKIIRRIMTAWRHVAKKENRVETQPSKLIKDYLQSTYFFSDELNFFPQQLFTWDYCTNGYNFVILCYNESSKTSDISSNPDVLIDFMEVFEHADLQCKQEGKSLEQREEKHKELKQLHETWQKFKQCIEIIRKYHKKKDEIIDDKEWKILQEKINMSKQLLDDNAEMPIEDAIRNYNWCVKYFGDIKEYVHIFELIKYDEQKIQIVASDQVFTNNEMFSAALEKLKNCDTENFHQLIEPLCNVNQPLQEKIWNADFKEICTLAKTILTIVKENKTFVMQLKQCLKVDLHALLRIMSDDAMVQKKKDEFVQARQQGNWLFNDYNTIYSANSCLKNGKYEGLTLQFGSNKLTCEEIEHSIDLLKLGLTSEEKKDIETIISQFEICKDIYAIRMDYWEKGGISFRDNLNLAASNPIPNFEGQQNKWMETLNRWNKACIKLRHDYPCLTYFTMNEIQQLVKDLNHIKAHKPQYWDILASKYIVPFLQRLDYQLQDASQVLHEWKDQNSKDMRPLQELGRIFSQVWMESKNNETAPNSFSILSSLKSGRPNLVIANHNNKLFSMLSLYESIGLVPRAEHVLLCKETTTEEEVECLMLRALLYVNAMGINSKTPLYCLVWPEKLQTRILEKVVNLFQKYFFEPSRSRRIQLYLFAVISSNRDNALSYFLRGLEWNASGELNNHQFYINEALYSQKIDISPANARGRSFYRVQLYESTKVGSGKSWKIQRDIQYLRQHINRVQSVRVRFNSANIDWEGIVKTLWKYHPCQVNSASKDSITGVEKRITNFNYFKDNWIVYHIDVSSCVNKDINDFFFQLLYLQHIDAMNCSFHVNPNMIFFIEIPCKLDMFSGTLHNFFYTLFFNTRLQVKSKLPAFDVGDKGRSSIKWMEEFFTGKLKQSNFVTHFLQILLTSSADISAERSDLSVTEINQLMNEHFPELATLSRWHIKMFFNYLFTQFEVLANSRFLLNECIPFRHEATKCAIEFAKDLCFYSYNEEETKTTYNSQFYLCEKWKQSKDLLYLVNQDGSLSLLAAKKDQLNNRRLEPLKKINCPAISWEQETNNEWNEEEKKKRMEFLFRAVNVPEEKRENIQKKCDKDFEHY
ncbi:ring finger protein, partial [Reticulomyxa filosa]